MALDAIVIGAGQNGLAAAARLAAAGRKVAVLERRGAVGEGAHSPNENILIRALPQRAALLAGLLSAL